MYDCFLQERTKFGPEKTELALLSVRGSRRGGKERRERRESARMAHRREGERKREREREHHMTENFQFRLSRLVNRTTAKKKEEHGTGKKSISSCSPSPPLYQLREGCVPSVISPPSTADF